ncbi:MAG: glutamate synthase [Lachnospiraceae bacterium]|nr:glutamate synthase [Lachnospiraceae bacterium]
MVLDVKDLQYNEINEQLRAGSDDIQITGCCGQRFIAAGFSDKKIDISGIPGNALGAYLNGATINVNGNAQDAVGDTMNAGKIIIHGSIGDAAGYAMRGGEIYVQGDAGYRAGIHMKEYKEKRPVIVIGGKCGSFLGEYQAGGIIIVLGLSDDEREIVSNFPCTGMHGGVLYLRSDAKNIDFPSNVSAAEASAEDLDAVKGYINEFCGLFGYNTDEILNATFTKVVPDSKNPYKQMYVAN